jgi:hypothetical protein
LRTLFSTAVIIFLATVPILYAQQAQPPSSQPAQAQQPPQDQQSSSQEASQEETTRNPKVKARNYKTWSFNVGGGAGLPSGTTKTYVRGGGGIAAVGVARNYSKYFGLRADFQFDNLPLRNQTLELAQAPGATSHVYSFMFDPIINISVSPNWGGYIVFGPSYYHRSGKLDSSTAIPGSACNGFFVWWGTCYAGSLPLDGKFLSSSQNEFGENFGGGITRKIRPNLDFYVEFRYLHGKHGGITTDLRPITVGMRW